MVLVIIQVIPPHPYFRSKIAHLLNRPPRARPPVGPGLPHVPSSDAAAKISAPPPASSLPLGAALDLLFPLISSHNYFQRRMAHPHSRVVARAAGSCRPSNRAVCGGAAPRELFEFCDSSKRHSIHHIQGGHVAFNRMHIFFVRYVLESDK